MTSLHICHFSVLRHVAGITNDMLVGEPKFPAVATLLNNWFEEILQDKDSGVLVSHNTSTDIQYLAAEYIRHSFVLPTKIRLGYDTYETLQRFASLYYRKVAPEDWSVCTAKGKPSMGVKPCATYALTKRVPPETFTEACGDHHDAVADTRVVAVIAFDYELFGIAGLYHCIFKRNRRCFQPLKEIWDAMRIKMKETVIQFEPLPPGWIPAPVTTLIATSYSRTAP